MIGLLGFQMSFLIAPIFFASITTIVFALDAIMRIFENRELPGRGIAIAALTIGVLDMVAFVPVVAMTSTG